MQAGPRRFCCGGLSSSCVVLTEPGDARTAAAIRSGAVGSETTSEGYAAAPSGPHSTASTLLASLTSATGASEAGATAVAATVETLTVALADSKLKLRELKRAVGGPVP
jgi:hypothetical protein